jgi:hypothetical protein
MSRFTHKILSWSDNLYSLISKKLYQYFIIEKLDNIVGYLLLGFFALAISWTTASKGIEFGIALMAIVLGIPISLACLLNIQVGFIIILLVSSFTFFLPRISGLYDLPFGSIPDILLLFVFCGIFIDKENRFKKVTAYKSPIIYVILLWIGYLLIQVFNPNSLSTAAWLLSVRGIVGYILTYFILIRLFDSLHYVKIFTIAWLSIALLASVYALYQEFIGLPDYDLAWISRSPKSIGLNFIRGRWRKWSFLSDPATFGMFMSFGGIFSVVLGLNAKDLKKKIILIILGILFLVTMTYSGTRTAVAMTVAGIVLYGTMTIHRKSTIVLGGAAILLVLAIIFFPYYGSATINSVRSTFTPSQDASFNVRVANKERIQPYIRSHPIGGGINTTGALGESLAPEHPLAGFPPDSYYMSLALETGWIGVGIYLFIFFVILLVGILNYYRCRNPKIKALYAAYIASFFALTIAGYAQESITQRPMGFVFYACFVLMDQLKYFDSESSA